MRESLRAAGVPYDRVWPAALRDADPDDPSATRVRA
jgi:hypothetical protein